MAFKRFRGEPLLPCHFSLGRAGLLINTFSLLFLLFSLIIVSLHPRLGQRGQTSDDTKQSFFPPVPDPAVDTANWSILVYGVVVIFSLVYYQLKGRHQYEGPVTYVRKSL